MPLRTVLALAFCLAACGAQEAKTPPPASAPGSPGAPAAEFAAPPPPAEPATAAQATEQEGGSSNALEESRRDDDREELASAEAELERARRELDGVLGPAQTSESAPSSAAPARPATGAGRAAADAPKSKPAEKKASENGCVTACRAFNSLKRAASAVCRLAGAGDARCGRAKETVADAERRVARCSCLAE